MKRTIFIIHGSYGFPEENWFPKPIDSLFLVGGWLNYRWYPKKKKKDSFHQKPFLWTEVKKNVKYIEFYQSTNDPTGIPVSDGKAVAKYLDAKYILVKESGHFSFSYDKKYAKFPLLFKNIKKRLSLS